MSTNREPMHLEPPEWAEWLEEKDTEIARLKDALRAIRDFQAFSISIARVRCNYCNHLDTEHSRAREHYDWCPVAVAKKALEEEKK